MLSPYQTIRVLSRSVQTRPIIPDIAELDRRLTRLTAQPCDNPERRCRLLNLQRRVTTLLHQKPQAWRDANELCCLDRRISAEERGR